MTAISVIKHTDAIHLLTDGSALSTEGAAAQPSSKVHVMPHLNAAFSARGPAFALALLGGHLPTLGSFGQVKADLRDAVKTILDQYGEFFRSTHLTGDRIDVVIAGWAESGGSPEAFLFANHTSYPGVEPWELTEYGELGPAPADPEIMDRFWRSVFARNPDCQAVADLDPVLDGGLLLDAQRGHRETFDDGTAFSIVGEFGQLTTIRRGEITTKIIRDWRVERPEVA